MANKITYLFGAGASANSVPVVKDFSKGLNDYLSELKKIKSQFGNLIVYRDDFNPQRTQKQIHEEMVKDLEWLIESVSNHASIDTYAKKLAIRKEKANLTKLKALICCFLGYIQYKEKVDNRYDSFFASILDVGLNDQNPIEPRINFLSWNYDCQFEKAFQEFSELNSIKKIQGALNVYTDFSQSIDNTRSFLLKLNGTAGFLDKKEKFHNIIDNYRNFASMEDVLKDLLIIYRGFIQDPPFFRNTLSFAWEHDVNQKALNPIFQDSEILIIIGYSFPFFNRKVDKMVLSPMRNFLKKIYIQCREDDISGVKDSLLATLELDPMNASSSDRVVLITSTQRFYIPHEL